MTQGDGHRQQAADTPGTTGDAGATPTSLIIGLDVGSTTVKATVLDPDTLDVLWADYQRHQTHQAEMVLEFLVRIGHAFPDVPHEAIRIFVTGSGAQPLAEPVGARFVQEVNAVTMAVEHRHPDVGSVVELGGQDAKIIIFKENEKTGDKLAQASMNDKCASGTGATIDKCMIKIGIHPDDACALRFDPTKLHHVAAKCGVFAETDIVNLVKTGIPANEILCSLADAIVMQNLSVLTRGSTLRHKVLLLGGPNTYLPVLQDCWRIRIPESWAERCYEYPQDLPVEDLIIVPEDAQYYAAFGAAVYGLQEPAHLGMYAGIDDLKAFVQHGRKAKLGEGAGPPLVADSRELEAFSRRYAVPPFVPPPCEPGTVVRAAIGLDGGSTSSKAVLVDEQGTVLRKAYQLSKGNPILDMRELLASLKASIEDDDATLEILGFGVTGYAGDVLDRALRADANIVETVAHMMSAVEYCGDVDVVCDVGGQDIKVLFLQNGDIKNFRLSNQCSAGNGMLLQAMADQFGLPVTAYAETAFGAELSPVFSYGCAVFLDSDRVNFQKEGYAKEELLAGLALVLPKNIWQYVVQIPRMAELGKRFVLQGGTQNNLAAVKAQVDYITERVPDAEVSLHPHPGEAGAIGAAMEALRVVKRQGTSRFVGLDAAIALEYSTRNDEETRCTFCPNNCSRTFIDTRTPDGSTARYISGFSCEKGTVESLDAVQTLNKERRKIMKQYPNLVAYEAKRCFGHFTKTAPMPEAGSLIDGMAVRRTLLGGRKRVPVQRPFERSSDAAGERRGHLRIGMPKVLNMWSTGPFWRAYFEALGIPPKQVVFSDDTSEELWLEGGKYGSVDPCYPSKVAQAHIHNLLFQHHSETKPLHFLYFPCITHIDSFAENTMDNASCPIVAGAPNVIKAAFTKEVDFFAQRNIDYVDTAVTFTEPTLLKRQLFDTWGPRLEITEDENDFAVEEARRALKRFDDDLQEKGRAILEQIEADDRIGILLLGRPYHNDPGINHSVLEEFQVLGYPILSIRSIPKDPQWLRRFFESDLESGRIDTPLDISDVWPENYSANSVQKVWGAKFAARHPNLAVVDLSSFKCGHDAPTYGMVDSIISAAGTPYSALHDIDANRPGGSIAIRVKTYAHSLMLHEERLQDLARKRVALEQRIAEKRLQLFEMKQADTEQRLGHRDPELDRTIASLRRDMAGERDAPAAELAVATACDADSQHAFAV